MSDPTKQPVTVNAVLQLITLAVLGTGGYVGKEAYDDLAERLTEARIEAAELRTAVQGLVQQRDDSTASLEALRARHGALEMRVTALEVQAQAQGKRR